MILLLKKIFQDGSVEMDMRLLSVNMIKPDLEFTIKKGK